MIILKKKESLLTGSLWYNSYGRFFENLKKIAVFFKRPYLDNSKTPRFSLLFYLVLVDNDTFILDEKHLPVDEISSSKLACKTKLNIHGGLDKLKARICLGGDMQIKDDFISWSPTTSTRFLECCIVDAAKNT